LSIVSDCCPPLIVKIVNLALSKDPDAATPDTQKLTVWPSVINERSLAGISVQSESYVETAAQYGAAGVGDGENGGVGVGDGVGDGENGGVGVGDGVGDGDGDGVGLGVFVGGLVGGLQKLSLAQRESVHNSEMVL